jgi:transposase
LGFHDESGVSEKPTVRRTWGLVGKTPIIQSTGSWKNLSLLGTVICTPRGRKPQLFLKSQPGTVNWEAVIKYLKELKEHLRGRKLLLFWDGLPAHRSKIVKAFLKTQQDWLKVKRLPAYAPELNPPEYLWSAMKAKDVGNLRPDGLSSVGKAVKRSYCRVREQPDFLIGFLKASNLF